MVEMNLEEVVNELYLKSLLHDAQINSLYGLVLGLYQRNDGDEMVRKISNLYHESVERLFEQYKLESSAGQIDLKNKINQILKDLPGIKPIE